MQAANPSAYFASGAAQSFTIELDDGTAFDTSQFAYFAEIFDEAGTGAVAGNTFTCVIGQAPGIYDTRPQ